MDNFLYQKLIKQYHDKKLSHAFLLETDNMENCKKEIINFLKYINCNDEYQDNCNKCNICHLLETNQIPSLKIIEPDGQIIKKEQILELKKEFQTKPIYTNYNMYLIIKAETLNSSSANTMLKFLEEPEDNILGFYITNNKENVINTIKSRCQIITVMYHNQNIEEDNKNLYDLAKDFVKEYEIIGKEAIVYINQNILLEINNLKDCVSLILMMLKIYKHLLMIIIEKEEIKEEDRDLQFILKKGEKYISKQVSYLINMLEEGQFNVNYQLLLERFVLEER